MTKIENEIVNSIENKKDELVNLVKKRVGFLSENEGIPDTGKETQRGTQNIFDMTTPLSHALFIDRAFLNNPQKKHFCAVGFSHKPF